MTNERTWQIPDGAGGYRTVTLAQFRAELNRAYNAVQPVVDAFNRGDSVAMAAAQKALRERNS